LRDRIGISKMSYFPAVSQLLRTGGAIQSLLLA
jgi:hypothetical protein